MKLPRDDTRKRGTWKPLRLADGTLSATIACPECGDVATLEDHLISPQGLVSPSIVCPGDQCQFHAHVELEGWNR